MSVLALLLAAAAPANAPAERVLGCQMVTPAGDPVLFSARLGHLTGVLEPVAGTSWPATRVIGSGGWREKKRLEAYFHFGGRPTGIDLKVEGERATLLVGRKLRSGLPRAYGFCLPAVGAQPVAGNVLVSASAGAAVPAFDTARWPDNRCALVTRSGKRAWISYTLGEGGTRLEIRSPDADLVPGTKIVVTRSQAASGPSRFGGSGGPAGLEWFAIDHEASQAAKLIAFDRIGADDRTAEPAAAICGYKSIERRAVAE